MEDVFLIDEKGMRLSSDTISSHIGLANLVIEKNEEIKKEFEQSGKRNPLEFLLVNKGYVATTENGSRNIVTYDSELITVEQRNWMAYYAESGYHFHDLAQERKKMERGEL